MNDLLLCVMRGIKLRQGSASPQPPAEDLNPAHPHARGSPHLSTKQPSMDWLRLCGCHQNSRQIGVHKSLLDRISISPELDRLSRSSAGQRKWPASII